MGRFRVGGGWEEGVLDRNSGRGSPSALQNPGPTQGMKMLILLHLELHAMANKKAHMNIPPPPPPPLLPCLRQNLEQSTIPC